MPKNHARASPPSFRQLIQTSPDDQERIGNHVLSVVRMRSALNKSHQVRVHRLVERAERGLPATISHKEIHALYLSATEQVCRNGLDKGGHRGARYRARPFAAGHWFASEKKTDLPDRTNVPITERQAQSVVATPLLM